MVARGLVIAAPGSGAGKTTVTLGLLRALSRRGLCAAGAKSGPDYIDPAFHRAACGRTSVNLDAWAMTPDSLRARAAGTGADLLLVEGAVGVLDGAGKDARGSAADLAQALGLPIVLVVDAARTGGSAALAPAGLKALRPDLTLAGVILNHVGSTRHAAFLRAGMARAGVPVLGTLPRDPALRLSERHLGLVQAAEHDTLEPLIEAAADAIADGVDLDALTAAARPLRRTDGPPSALPPLGQRIAVASDIAFAFCYPHFVDDWRAAGVEVLPFSPLADEAPDGTADAVFLPGGYPELHAGAVSAAARFRQGMRAARDRGARIYGECGGYMVLGEGLEDADGQRHAMLGLLPLATSFARRKLSLGYRMLRPQVGAGWHGMLAAHEFHYATILSEPDRPQRLFEAWDADGTSLEAMGLVAGSVSGSFAHVIGPAPQASDPAAPR